MLQMLKEEPGTLWHSLMIRFDDIRLPDFKKGVENHKFTSKNAVGVLNKIAKLSAWWKHKAK